MKPLYAILIAVTLLGVSCAKQSMTNSNELHFARTVRIKVTQVGVIHLNEKVVTLDELKEEFVRLKADNGAVLYYRENPQGEPPEQVTNVMKAVIDAKLPIKLCQTEEELNQPQ
ncbi:MAG: hypothetical protein LC729_04620 [Acidobacteria bacterium]|nr:hypothetical protein [Acidobacteriota bacterium]